MLHCFVHKHAKLLLKEIPDWPLHNFNEQEKLMFVNCPLSEIDTLIRFLKHFLGLAIDKNRRQRVAERILPRSNLSWTSKELVGLAAFKSLEMVLLWNKGTFCRLSELATSWNSCVESEKENVGEKATGKRINKPHKQQLNNNILHAFKL